MKSINLPKILLILFFVVLVISILGAFFIDPASLFIIYYFGFIVSPISVLLLIVWKLINRGITNKYFISVLVLNIILFILSLILTLHLFDNFMSLS